MIHRQFVLAVVMVVGLGGIVTVVSTTTTRVPHRASLIQGSRINVEEIVNILPITERTRSLLPPVYGWLPCGGRRRGVVTAYRCQNCSWRETCTTVADTPHLTELDFVPNYSSSGLGMRLKVYNESGIPTVMLDRPLENSKVAGGGGARYRVHAIGSASSHFKGQNITLQYILYDVSSEQELICIEADYKVV